MVHPCNSPIFSKAPDKDESIKQLEKYGVSINNHTIENTGISPENQMQDFDEHK